jgi:hypothetical protein
MCMQPPWLSLDFSGHFPPGTNEEIERGRAAFAMLESAVCVRALASLELRGYFGGVGMGDGQRGARLFSQAQTLRRLVVVGQGFKNVGEFCASAIQSLAGLEEFSLDSSGFSTQPVVASLCTSSALTSLRLGDCVDRHAVEGALAFMPSMARLDLDKISGDEWFLESLGRASALMFLRLRGVEGQAGAQALARLVQSRALAVELDVLQACQGSEFARNLHMPSGSTLAIDDPWDGEALVVEVFRSGCAFGCSDASATKITMGCRALCGYHRRRADMAFEL